MYTIFVIFPSVHHHSSFKSNSPDVTEVQTFSFNSGGLRKITVYKLQLFLYTSPIFRASKIIRQLTGELKLILSTELAFGRCSLEV